MTSTQPTDIAAIEQLAQTYFDALYTGNAELFATIFHPRAMLYCAGGESTVVMGVDAYLEIVAGRETPEAKGDPRQEEILQITLATPTTAHLRVRELFLPKRFTDELVLMKEDGRWRIVAKVWDFEILEKA